MPFSQTSNSVTVAVDPHIQPDRQKEVFDVELKKFGVLPVQLHINNSGNKDLSIDDTFLELPDGRRMSRVDAEKVARRASWVLRRHYFSPSLQYAQEPITPLLGIILSFAFNRANEAAIEKAYEARIADYKDKEFHEKILPKNSSIQGFVYFHPPEGTLWYTKAKLALRFVDKTDGTSFEIRVPLSNSGFKGLLADAKKQQSSSE